MRLKGEREIRSSFGFIANPSSTIWENTKSVLGKTLSKKYFNQITNTAHHNLCMSLTPPNGIGTLLGLGMKFCLKLARPNKMLLASAFERLRKDIRLRHIFGGDEDKGEDNNSTYNPKLYIKSEWQPDAVSANIEKRVDQFEVTLTAAHESIIRNTQPSSNLSILQQKHLKTSRNNPDFIILDSDKNIGPCIVERDTYIKNVLVEHLNTKTYKQISKDEATKMLDELLEEIKDLLFEHETDIDDSEKILQQRIKTATQDFPILWNRKST